MSSFDTSSLEGKPFQLGTQDCFTAVRDFYKKFFDIDIPNFSRPNDWEAEKDNLIEKLYPKAGFQKLDVDEHWPPRPGDIMVCVFRGSVPDHLVIYLGSNEILHHTVGRFSSKEPMRPAWRRYTSYILRHPEVPDLVEQKPTLTLKEVYDENLV